MKDHEMVKFNGRLIPVLGTVGGTKEQSEETARNIENYFAEAEMASIERKLKRRVGRALKKKGLA